ncbi:MAG TPA: NTP transferase domain-containing protein [Vicinamibacterales bacterium]|nr:NTP transferase domain-containing protein [Vicinamibacterales bacterium]
MQRVLVVPAAGLGSRLKATLPKALVPVAGRPMIDHLLALFHPWAHAAVVVAHPSFSDRISAHVRHAWRDRMRVEVVEQAAPTGMLDAILAASAAVERLTAERVWTVWCDQVGLLPATLERLAAAERTAPAPALVLPTVHRADPYIHFARAADNRIVAVLQRREHDAMPASGESDVGLFALSRVAYLDELPRFAREVAPGAGTGERNFLPFIPWLAARVPVATVPCTDPRESQGVNTPDELRLVEDWLLARSDRP